MPLLQSQSQPHSSSAHGDSSQFLRRIDTFLLCIIKSHSACRWCCYSSARSTWCVCGWSAHFDSRKSRRNEHTKSVTFSNAREPSIALRTLSFVHFNSVVPSRSHSLRLIENAINSNSFRGLFECNRDSDCRTRFAVAQKRRPSCHGKGACNGFVCFAGHF